MEGALTKNLKGRPSDEAEGRAALMPASGDGKGATLKECAGGDSG